MRIDRLLLRRLAGLRFGARGLASGRRAGDRRSRVKGQGIEFADFREYGVGDDLKLVDWNVYERLGTVLVRLFHEDRNLRIRYWNCAENQNNTVYQTKEGATDFQGFTFAKKDNKQGDKP